MQASWRPWCWDLLLCVLACRRGVPPLHHQGREQPVTPPPRLHPQGYRPCTFSGVRLCRGHHGATFEDSYYPPADPQWAQHWELGTAARCAACCGALYALGRRD